MSEQQEPQKTDRIILAHAVIDELREMKDQPPFEPTADIDMVWVLSAPGTIKEASDDGIYEGESADLVNISAGIDLVRKITAIRLGKQEDAVTKEDIEKSGPTFFYNGEDKDTENVKYLQNEHLAEALQDPNFPLPASKVVIDHIPGLGTPAQVKGIAEYLHNFPPDGKVAVVSMIHHSARVSRYIQKYRDQLPEGVVLVNAPIPETVNKVGKTLREVRKIVDYAAKGDLSEEPYFKS